ncbi:MAG: serine hydrolase [Saccharofermentanales bacterium]
MRKASSGNRPRNTGKSESGIRQARIRQRPKGAPQDKKIDSMNLGAILSGNTIRRKKRNHDIQVVLVVLSFMILSVVAFLLIRNYANNGPVTSADSSSLSSQASVLEDSSGSSISSGSLSLSGTASASAASTSAASVDAAARTAAFEQLKSKVSAFTDEFDGRIGVYYINLMNGETFGIGEKNPFVAASSIKMGIVTQLYKSIIEGKFKLTQMLTYDNRPYPTGDLEYGTGIIVDAANGTQYSIRRTAQLAITISDNCATNMIIRTLGGIDTVIPALNAISAEVPYRTSVSYNNYKGSLVSGRHRTSAKDLAMYARYFYDQWLLDKDGYAPLMEDLQNTVFTFGVQTKLPATVKVAHKIGTNYDYRTENDVGIIFADEPYVICVTTECESQAAGRGAVADVSLMFYEYISGLK